MLCTTCKCTLDFFISNFRRVLNVVFFLLGYSPGSEFADVSEPSVNSIFIGRPHPMKMGQCSETTAHKIQAPGNHPKERIQHIPFPRNSVVFYKVAKNLKASENNQQRRLEQYVLRIFPNSFKAVSFSELLLLLFTVIIIIIIIIKQPNEKNAK